MGPALRTPGQVAALADVRYFCSLTMHDLTNNLVKNPIHRWAIGSLGKPYTLDKDGGLTL